MAIIMELSISSFPCTRPSVHHQTIGYKIVQIFEVYGESDITGCNLMTSDDF